MTQYCNDYSPSFIRKTFKIKKKLGVAEWIYRVSNAEFVVTDSFHGTVFAILYHKPFITTLISAEHKLNGMNERIISLLSFLGLEDRMFDKFDPTELRTTVHNKIDWDAVDLRIMEWRKEADDFLGKRSVTLL